jgi:hypothetical protein
LLVYYLNFVHPVEKRKINFHSLNEISSTMKIILISHA